MDMGIPFEPSSAGWPYAMPPPLAMKASAGALNRVREQRD
jgi:hypothetical protein